MQSVVQPVCANNLASIRHGIAALCYERTRVQIEQGRFRHCPRDERHDAWEQKLQTIENRRQELIQQQNSILKQSQKCGVGVNGLCI